MSGEFAAAGDIISGALAARSVEPHTGEHGDHGSGICLNCGTRLIGSHCHACGQSGHVHRTLGAIGHELAHGVFHFEGKIWRTLPMLAFRPGTLTRRYIDGERARFVSPMALFLFVVFVLFAFLSVVGAHLEVPAFEGTKAAEAKAALSRSITENEARVAALDARLAKTTAPAEITRLNGQIAERRNETTAMKTARTAIGSGELDELKSVHTGWKRLDKGIAKAAENPNLALYKVQSNAYKFAWALIPLSLPFMWLLFPFSRRFGFYDHAVFVTYSLCFVLTVIMIVAMVSAWIGWGTTSGLLLTAALFGVPVHMYKQLRGTYGGGRFGALLRTMLLFIVANLTLPLFVFLLLGLGLVG